MGRLYQLQRVDRAGLNLNNIAALLENAGVLTGRIPGKGCLLLSAKGNFQATNNVCGITQQTVATVFHNALYPNPFPGIIAPIGRNDILAIINPLGEERLDA